MRGKKTRQGGPTTNRNSRKKNEDNGYEGMVEENFITEMKKSFPRIEHRAFPEQSHKVNPFQGQENVL